MKGIVILALIIFATLSAQANEKHPRVAELEDKYKSDATRFLEARFPGLPFSVTLSIDPLRRNSGKYEIKGEQLPFYALDEEQIRDEWDDPTTTLYSLSNRVKKIEMIVQVPSSLKDDEIAEIQTTLTNNLRLIPARDEIQILKREWTLFPNLKIYALFAGMILLIFLLGLFLVSRAFANRMVKSIDKIKSSSASAGPNQGPVAPLVKPQGLKNKSESEGSDLRFNDPIKVREVAVRRVEDLLNNNDFIRLENFIKLDELGHENPETLGALLTLFPMSTQKEVFSFSTGEYWMKAFNDPGEVTFTCLEYLEDMNRVKAHEYREFWELLLIQTWRLGPQAIGFLKSLDTSEALAILVAMPKQLAVPLAREAFPGNWAAVLDPEFQSTVLTENDCENLFKIGLAVKPLIDFSLLDIYKKESELLTYLSTADVRTEREIYSVTPDDAMIKQIRPAFYVIFNEGALHLELLVEKFNVEHWSLALFNVDRDSRRIIEGLFSEKEKFFFLEKLKYWDKNNPSMEFVGQIRSEIAQHYRALLDHPPVALHEEINSETDSEEEDNVEDVA